MKYNTFEWAFHPNVWVVGFFWINTISTFNFTIKFGPIHLGIWFDKR